MSNPEGPDNAQKRTRGRRPNRASRDLLQQDQAIAAAVDTMCGWGFPLRDGVCKAVAHAASTTWVRKLGADAVEKIWERMSDAYGSGKPLQWSRYRVDWRREGLPTEAATMTPTDLAARLLRNGGAWVAPQLLGGEEEPFAPRGDSDNLTAGAKAKLVRLIRKTG